MQSQRRAVYAGSFDPITNGHLWLIEHGAPLFDELIVAVGINPEKKYLFPANERLAMLAEVCKRWPNVRVASFEHLYLIKYAEQSGARYILRGIRNEADYLFERGMRHINAEFNAGIETLFMIPPRDLSEISSSFVKGLIGPTGWAEVVKKYVPGVVYERFLERFGRG